MDELDEMLLEQWDNLNAAIDRVVTALPAQMSVASESLEQERLKMRATINEWALKSIRQA